MRVVVAPTAFKGTFTPGSAASRIAAGWRRARPGDDVVELPMADGGDGTAETLRAALGGTWMRRTVRDPLGRPRRVRALLLPDGAAVVETAAASGLALLRDDELDPLRSDTRGTGALIGACLAAGARRVLLGLGGSATTDGGAGCAHALGARFLDRNGRELEPTPLALLRVTTVVRGPRLPVVALTDVAVPLADAAPMFGPQKGASPADVRLLARALVRLCDAAGSRGAAARAGAGAAGGLGFGVVALLGGRVVPGASAIADLIALDDAIARADLVITGEGSLDEQTLRGKAPAEVLRRARRAGVPCAAIVGRAEIDGGFARVVELSGASLYEASRNLANAWA